MLYITQAHIRLLATGKLTTDEVKQAKLLIDNKVTEAQRVVLNEEL